MANDYFIETSSFEAIRRKSLFYPSAGCDWNEPLAVFANHVDEFWFVDTAYGLSTPWPVFALNSEYRCVSSRITGSPDAQQERRTSETGRSYRHIEPANLCEVFERPSDGRRITVNRRRGFGQYALTNEFSDASIGVFVHRGDSPGEGGSNVYYLANRARDHEPCSNLLAKLVTKLAHRALIVSDGSNSRCRKLKRFHCCNDVSGNEAFAQMKSERICFGGLNWRCVGYLSNKYGPTLVWEVHSQRPPDAAPV